MDRRSKQTPTAKRGAQRLAFFRLAWPAPAALGILTALVYARSLAVPIYDLDDNTYYFGDARVANLTLGSLWHILTKPFFENFHPLTTLTFAFDRAVWGTWVPGFHVTQLVFYVGGVLGLYFLFARILGWRPGAFLAAALYATHAVHVESVAWLASRKDVVCLFFYAMALLAYVRHAGTREARGTAYIVSIAMAAGAMLSKGYALCLPGVLFAYDLCFAARITRRHILEKIPFFAIAVVVGLLTVFAQDKDSALIQSTITGEGRAALLAKVLALYIGRALLPIRLSAFYTVADGPAGPAAALGVFLALVLVAGFFLLRRRIPPAAFGIALFLLPLGTVMNLFFTLRIWMTDRYLLFPTVGSCLALVALAAPLYQKRQGVTRTLRLVRFRRGLAVIAVLAIGLYSGLTIARVDVWTSRVRLWSDVVRKELHLGGMGPVTSGELRGVTNLHSVPSGPIVSLARAYDFEGKHAESRRIDELMGVVARGGYKDEEGDVAVARQAIEAGRPEEALRRLKPIAEGGSWWAPVATLWISVAESRMGDADSSRQTLRRAIELYRKSGQVAADGLISVGDMEFSRGDFPKAAEWYRRAEQELPHDAKVIFRLGRAREEGGAPGEALKLYKEIVDANLPILRETLFSILDVHYQMGVAAQKLGLAQEAREHFEEALRHSPEQAMREDILSRIATLHRANGSH